MVRNEHKKISILGCGWFGLPLAKQLLKQGYLVKGSATSAEKVQQLKEEGVDSHLLHLTTTEPVQDTDFFDSDLLIISIPPRSKSPDASGYPFKLANIADAVIKSPIKQVILISSTGVFEDGNFVVDENTIPKPTSEAGKIIYAGEQLLKSRFSFQPTIVRFAGLIGPNRNLAKHFAGKTEILNGLAPINLIHLDDCIGLILSIIEQSAFGHIYHGVTPHHPTRASFYTSACLKSGFAEPHFLEDKLSWKQVDSKNVPEILTYEFKIPSWEVYLENYVSEN